MRALICLRRDEDHDEACEGCGIAFPRTQLKPLEGEVGEPLMCGECLDHEHAERERAEEGCEMCGGHGCRLCVGGPRWV